MYKLDSVEIPSPASTPFAARLAKYAFVSPSKSLTPSTAGPSTPTKQGTPPRSSPRIKSTPQKRTLEFDEEFDDLESLDDGDYRHEAVAADEDEAEPEDLGMKSKKRVGTAKGKEKAKYIKKARGFASPDVYKHLRPINDLLKPELEVVFCGINPGKRSSTLGHHFAHPTNKFWRSLHGSVKYTGFTSRLLSPLEDHLMPEDYNLGLTNLVDRPTSEQSELSTLEMRVNVLSFTQKILKYRPRLVCFVGKKIWDIYEGVVVKSAAVSPGGGGLVESEWGDKIMKLEDGIKAEGGVKVENHVKLEDEVLVKVEADSMRGIKIEGKVVNVDVKPSPRAQNIKRERPSQSPRKKAQTQTPMDWTKPRRFRLPYPQNEGGEGGYCYFWVVPNTSGLERTPLAEQIVLFDHLRYFSQLLASGQVPPDISFRDISLEGIEKTVKEIETAALIKSQSRIQ